MGQSLVASGRSGRIDGRITAVRVTVVVVLAALVVWYLWAVSLRHGLFDLQVYYGAIRYWLHGGGGLYDYLRPGTKYGFTYPPFAALVMAPMGLLGWNATAAISVVATCLSTLVVLYLFVDPLARAHGWNRLFTLVVAAELVAAFEPLGETLDFGQVNMLLLALVVVDVLLLVGPGRRLGGVGVGLATAIKLTPGVFILYLLVTRRWRAAGVAIATATGVTLIAALVAPDATRVFVTSALFDTARLGSMSFISNQSLDGLVNRLDPANPSTPLWIALVLAVVVLWWLRVRRTAAAGDVAGGLALTGVLGTLISPVTWVHHMVFLLPALLLVVRRGLDATGRRRAGLLTAGALLYAVLSSRVVWHFGADFGGWGLLGGNAYLYAAAVLLVIMPVGDRPPAGPVQAQRVPDLGQFDGRAAGSPDGVPAGSAVGGEPEALVEPARPRVVREHP